MPPCCLLSMLLFSCFFRCCSFVCPCTWAGAALTQEALSWMEGPATAVSNSNPTATQWQSNSNPMVGDTWSWWLVLFCMCAIIRLTHLVSAMMGCCCNFAIASSAHPPRLQNLRAHVPCLHVYSFVKTCMVIWFAMALFGPRPSQHKIEWAQEFLQITQSLHNVELCVQSVTN